MINTSLHTLDRCVNNRLMYSALTNTGRHPYTKAGYFSDCSFLTQSLSLQVISRRCCRDANSISLIASGFGRVSLVEDADRSTSSQDVRLNIYGPGGPYTHGNHKPCALSDYSVSENPL